MSLAQAFLQLGIGGALAFVFWKLGSKFLDNQRASESERTAVYAKAEADRTAVVASGFATINESHRKLGEGIATIKGALGVRTPAYGVPVVTGED